MLEIQEPVYVGEVAAGAVLVGCPSFSYSCAPGEGALNISVGSPSDFGIQHQHSQRQQY